MFIRKTSQRDSRRLSNMKAFKRQDEDFVGFDLVDGKLFAASYPDRLARCLENMAFLLNKGEEECETYLKSLYDVHSNSRDAEAHNKECDEVIAPYLSQFSSDDSNQTKSTSPTSTIDLQAIKNENDEDTVSLLSLPLVDSYDERAEWQYVDSDSTVDRSDEIGHPNGMGFETTMIIDHTNPVREEFNTSISSAFEESFQRSMEESKEDETCDTSLLSVDGQMLFVEFHGNLAMDCATKKSQSSDLLNAILCAASLASKSRRQRRNSGKAVSA